MSKCIVFEENFCLEDVYSIYWLCYHIHTYKKPHIALVHGLSVGGGLSLMVPMKFSVVTEKVFCSTPEANLGCHSDCGLSYILSRLPGRLGEYLGLIGAKLNGKEVVAPGLATHFVPSHKLFLLSIIDDCFSRETVEEILDSFEAEAGKKGNDWIMPVLKSIKKASPIGLKITLISIREGRIQTLSECLRREFRIMINTLTIISQDFYEGIRAAIIDKDESPKIVLLTNQEFRITIKSFRLKWNPSTLDKVHDEQLDLIFKPFDEHDLEL
uniref:3-hydroxyisobutyryl-CoA hydrolase n=1 Tax=Solanum lycopersicum TaxID=4081 RepID=A0A3Q7I6S3_SOLLC